MNYDLVLSDRIKGVQPSGIRKFFDILEEMKDAISLGIGEPDFVTPWHIRDAGIYSLEKGFTKYTSNAGMAGLRREIASYLERRFQLRYDFASQIIVTVGGSEAIDLALPVLSGSSAGRAGRNVQRIAGRIRKPSCAVCRRCHVQLYHQKSADGKIRRVFCRAGFLCR